MKKINRKNIFEYIYLLLAIVFLIFIPIVVVYESYIGSGYSYITKIRTNFSIIMSVIIFLVFLLDLAINKDKVKEIKTRKTILIFIGFLIWCYISTSFSSNVKNSLYGIAYRYNGLIQYLSYLGYGILGFSLSEKNRVRFFRLFTFTALSIGLLSIYNVELGKNVLPTQDYSGIFYNINHYGYFITYSVIIVIFLFIYGKNIILKIIDYFIYIFFIYLLIINDTFGTYVAVLGTLIIMVVYAFKKNIKILYLILMSSFIILSIFTSYNGKYLIRDDLEELFTDLNLVREQSEYNIPIDDVSNNILYVGNYRGTLWIHGIRYSLEKPIVGYGLDNLRNRYLDDDIDIDHPHNLIINLAATVGYPGMILYISALIILIIKGLRRMRDNNHLTNLLLFILINHFISSMFGITIYYETVYFIIMLGMAVKVFDVKKETKTDLIKKK